MKIEMCANPIGAYKFSIRLDQEALDELHVLLEKIHTKEPLEETDRELLHTILNWTIDKRVRKFPKKVLKKPVNSPELTNLINEGEAQLRNDLEVAVDYLTRGTNKLCYEYHTKTGFLSRTSFEEIVDLLVTADSMLQEIIKTQGSKES